MSILGAAGTGLMISGIIIKYQKSVYDAKINELKGYAQELDSHLQTLKTYRDEIRRFWDDNTAEKYITLINNQINQINVTRQSIDELSSLYDNLKQVLDNAQSTVSDKVDELGSLVASLTGLTE